MYLKIKIINYLNLKTKINITLYMKTSHLSAIIPTLNSYKIFFVKLGLFYET